MTTKTSQQLIRDYLRANPKGVDTSKIAKILGLKSPTAFANLKAMPDTYIAAWRITPHRTAVWRIVIPPPDCPPPPVVATPKATTKPAARSKLKPYTSHQPTGVPP